jgi:hypothetical protein
MTLPELDEASEAYDACVRDAGLDDPFCSASWWIVPSLRAFHPARIPWIVGTADGRDGFGALVLQETRLGRTMLPFESGWGLACPIVGSDPARTASRVWDELLADASSWNALFLSGLTRGGPVFSQLVRLAGRRFRLGLGEGTWRSMASLVGGEEGFLARRTPHFRKNLRQDLRRAGDTFRFTFLDDADEATALEAWDAVLEIEERSWKGMAGSGVTDGPMRAFYRQMIPRLARRGALRITFAWSGDARVGYVLGGVFGDQYRGLQFSFDDVFRRLSLGNLLQWATIRHLCADPSLRWYDLGTEKEYKAAWAERRVETVALVIR